MTFNRELIDRLVIDLTLWRVRYLSSYVYIRIPKSGSTMVIKSLGIRMEHLSAGEIIQKIGLRSWEKKFSFTFVRNPYARAVSLYFSFGPGQLCDSKTAFQTWARAYFDPELYPYRTAPALRPRWNQVHWVGGDAGSGVGKGGGGGLVDFIGRLENIEEDMEIVRKRLGLPSLPRMPHRNATHRGARYRDYFSDETRDIVGHWFREDLEQFGYTF